MAGKTLSAEALVRIWERGGDEHPLERALSILCVFCDRPRSELADWSIARRDAMLLACRAALVPGPLAGVAACPECSCAVEVSLAPTDLMPGGEDTGTVEVDGAQVAFRLPSSRDLADAAGCASVQAARSLLVARCLGDPDTDETTVAAVEEELERRVGIAGGLVDLTCPTCATAWSLAIDLGSFLWQEIAVVARRLLCEVDVLARRYGWSETEILSLSSVRRRFYLELAS